MESIALQGFYLSTLFDSVLSSGAWLVKVLMPALVVCVSVVCVISLHLTFLKSPVTDEEEKEPDLSQVLVK